jgi:hypothetical protein
MLRRFFLGALLAPLLALVSVLPAAAQSFNQRAVVNFTASGDTSVITGVAGKVIYIYGFDLALSTSTTLTFKSGSTALTGPMTLNAYSKQITDTSPYFVTNPGDNFVLSPGASATVAGVIWYRQQ